MAVAVPGEPWQAERQGRKAYSREEFNVKICVLNFSNFRTSWTCDHK